MDSKEDSATEPRLTQQTITGFKWSYLSTILQAGLQVMIFSAMAHLLTPREFGIVGMATIFTNFIERVGFLGVGQALVQREKLTDAHIRCGYMLCLLFGFLLFLIFYVSSPWIASFFEEDLLVPVLRIIGLSFVLACIAEVPLCLLQRELQFKQLLVVMNTSYVIGNGLVGIMLALLGFSYWALVYSIVAARVIRLVLAFRARPQHLSLDFSRRDAKDLLSIGVGFSLGRATNYCALVGDNFVTGKILGAQALGLYGRAYQLMSGPATYFGQVLEKVLFAALSQRQNEPAKVSKYFLYGVELCSLVSVGGSIMLMLAAEEIITVAFGKQWVGAVPAMKILAFGVFFRTCYKNSDTVIRALGAVYRLAWQQTIYAAIVIGGATYGSRWGIEGVSVAVMFAVLVNHIMCSTLSVKLLDLPWSAFFRAHLPAIWTGIWQYAAVYFTVRYCHAAQLPSLLTLVFATLSIGIATLLGLWLAPQSCIPKVFPWIGRNIELRRFGIIGKAGRHLLLRSAAV